MSNTFKCENCNQELFIPEQQKRVPLTLLKCPTCGTAVQKALPLVFTEYDKALLKALKVGVS